MLFTEDDTEAALAWQEAQDDACSGCGHPRSETMAPNGPDYQATPLRCRACEAREAAGIRWSRQDNGDNAGIKFAVTRREG